MTMNYRDTLRVWPIIALWTLFLIQIVFSTAITAADWELPRKRTIVLDPGHGGMDSGLTGPGGLSEKTATMRLSRLIASEFNGHHTVMITRTDDYQLDIQERTSQANHCKADVLISLHEGNDPNKILIYHSREIPQEASSWRQLQNRNIRSSVTLAEIIRKRFEQNGRYGKVEIRRAPILLLEGADMPALLIETGYLTLTHSRAGKTGDVSLADLANTIRSGIMDYLAMLDKKEIITDLHDR